MPDYQGGYTLSRKNTRYINRPRRNPRTMRRRLVSAIDEDLNVHHRWFPKRAYRTSSVAKRFRELHCQRVIAVVDEHVGYHRENRQPPPMPSHDEMSAQISRCENNGCDQQGCTQPIQIAIPEDVLVGIKLPREVILASLG